MLLICDTEINQSIDQSINQSMQVYVEIWDRLVLRALVGLTVHVLWSFTEEVVN